MIANLNGAWTNTTLTTPGGIALRKTFAPDYMGVRMRNVNVVGRVWADDFQVTPEPMTMTLMGLGIVGLIRRRKN